MKKNLSWLIALALLAAGPAAAGGGEAQRGGETVETKVEKRVLVVPGSGDVRLQPRVEVRVVDDGSGERRHFVWRDGSGAVHEFEGPEGGFAFAPGAKRGYLGVQLTDLTPELRTHFGAREDSGVLVAQVVADSPAAHAGLRVGDVLTHVDGEPVRTAFDVTARIGSRGEGDAVALEVVRDGRVETLSATLEERERAQIAVGPLLRRLGEEGSAFTYEFDPEALHEQLEGVEEYFTGPEWKTQLMEIEGLDDDIRERLEKLEVELQRLHEQLGLDVDVRLERQAEGDDG